MILALVLVSFVIFSNVGADPPGGYYTTRYDHIDIETILNQKRLVQYYCACLLDKGPCTPQGTEFKRILPEAIKTNCLRCTEKQRVYTLRTVRRLRKEYPDVWAQLAANWDPTGEHVQRLEQSSNKPNPPRSPPVEVLSDRFGDGEEIAPTTTKLPSSTFGSTTLNILVASSTVKQQVTTNQPQSTTVQRKPTTRKKFARPFNSIGPNLVVPNPKALFDVIGNKVISTAGVVFNTVQNVLNG